jgi:hypothetical protein
VIDRPRQLKGFSLHLEINGGVPVRRGDAGVAEPLTDRDDVDAGSEQMDGRAVSPMSLGR